MRPESLAAGWHARAEQLGFDADTRAKLFTRGSAVPASREVLRRATRELLGDDGLTARSPVFDRRDVLRGWCAQLPGGAPVSVVEQLADQLLTRRVMVPIDTSVSGLRPGAKRNSARHTTSDMLAVERRVLQTALPVVLLESVSPTQPRSRKRSLRDHPCRLSKWRWCAGSPAVVLARMS